MKIKNEKGISPVIATVLLIMITVAAVVLIAGFLIPWIKTSLPETNCVEVIGMLEIVEDKDYTCSSATEASVMIELGFEDVEISGIIFALRGEGESERFEIRKDDSQPTGVRMVGNWKFPEQGESRTYIFENIGFAADEAEVALILGKDNICEAVKMRLPTC